ncbi:hypothetical protein DYB30_003401 [Aphanomyces astaci]|uniref:Uncharacterized protein n=1 Tax=Aphanomyces astaci TaxID=112090 RepID=A0A397DFD3_APHAT|nr:hypothetical protein DYB30_003401 [Aphanomyces astaci]
MEGMDLNCAWRSAECVTSLYDRVRELELRNAELEAEVMQWRDQSRQSRMTDASTSVDLAKAIRERDEWRDRFKQQDDISRRLQKRVDAMQEEHKEQVAKLQERCLFDPNGPKRVQVCVASLQKTLDNRVQEHELMHQRLRETLDVNAALTRANATMEQERASFVGAIARHSAHRMFTLLHRLRKDVMVAAWSAWSRSTIRVSERQAREEGIQRLALVVKQSKQQRLQRQITRFTLQRARSTRSQVIKAWAFRTLAMRLARHRALDSYHASCRLIVSNAFKTWHERSVRRAHCTKVLLQLCDNHKRTRVHRGFSTWVQASRTLLIEMILLKCDVVEAEKANVVAELEGLKQNLSVSLAAQRSWEQAVRDLEIEHATAASNQDQTLNEWTTRLAVIYERGTSRRLQGLIFHAWKLRDVHRRHVRALLAHVQAQKLRALVRQWRQSLQTRHAATPMQHMQKRRHGRIQRETFAWWASQTRRAATRRRKLTHRRQLQAATSMQRHWRLWRESVARSVQRKARGASALHALAGMVGLHIQQRSFKAWEATVMGLVQRDLRLKWVVDTALSQSRMHRLGHVLARWKRYATLQRKQTVSLAFQARRRLDRLHVWAHSVWRMWFAQCAVQIHRRSALAEVVGRLRHRWLRRAVSQWAANGHLIAMHARFEQTVDELNRSMRLLQEHIQHQQAQHRSEADAMEVTMQITEESHQRAMAISATEWSQKLHQVQVDLERTEALRDALEGAAAEWHGHAKLELRRGQALETMLMESQAQWQHSFDLQSMQHHRHHMLEVC